jgi:hypothetical protein
MYKVFMHIKNIYTIKIIIETSETRRNVAIRWNTLASISFNCGSSWSKCLHHVEICAYDRYCFWVLLSHAKKILNEFLWNN